ncbi:MAG TPA: hypothetical protein VF891_00150 [Gaiellaceae bacterium]
MSPVYWKPRYPTRSMRERAWAKRALAREQAARRSRPPGVLSRVWSRLRRGT